MKLKHLVPAAAFSGLCAHGVPLKVWLFGTPAAVRAKYGMGRMFALHFDRIVRPCTPTQERNTTK